MFEQNKGAASPQASNLAGMFQNAGSFMPKQVNVPQITAPTAPTAVPQSSPSSKGPSSVVPTGGIMTPEQAAAATAARIQARAPVPDPVAPAVPTGPQAAQSQLKALLQMRDSGATQEDMLRKQMANWRTNRAQGGGR